MTQSTLARMRKRYTTPRTRDRGQTAFEYLGIILVVVVIIGAIVGTGIGQTITAKITTQIGAITAGK
ncbi:hypothetical protein EF903_18600 [Streptomyces sp. WAC05292]|uniref:hypothetical protein n=1 Tax=Streptomyces sp. WAC05292 TaxID=2487418 RepID=UPI000F74B5C7|nr:hypothetical protein [Streptomyces sp. WAC05292]RSS86610.1 hypothetical protein EF903_18600 [Streptomyces sp. WAC05292]